MLTADRQLETALDALREQKRTFQFYTTYRPVTELIGKLIDSLGASGEEYGILRQDIDNIAFHRVGKDLECFRKTKPIIRPTRIHKTSIMPSLVKRVDEITKTHTESRYVALSYGYMSIVSDADKMPIDQLRMKLTEECNEILRLEDKH